MIPDPRLANASMVATHAAAAARGGSLTRFTRGDFLCSLFPVLVVSI
jgi:hypothetical protein